MIMSIGSTRGASTTVSLKNVRKMLALIESVR